MKRQATLLKKLARSPQGMSADEVAQILGVKSTKGIGAKLAEAKNELREHAIEWDDVAKRQRDGNAMRWLPGSRIERARRCLEGCVASGFETTALAADEAPMLVLRTLASETHRRWFAHGVGDLAREADRLLPQGGVVGAHDRRG